MGRFMKFTVYVPYETATDEKISGLHHEVSKLGGILNFNEEVESTHEKLSNEN